MLIGYKQTRLQIIYVTKSAAIGTAELEIKCFDKNVFSVRNTTIIIAEIQIMIQMDHGVIQQIIAQNTIIA